jgi:hypothetical protein
MEQIIIGVDPHKLSATIEVVDAHERLLGSGRFATDRTGYAAMRKYAKAWPERVWAVEGANGARSETSASPGGHCGASLKSSAVDFHPLIDTSDQPLPGPANPTLRPASDARKRTLRSTG